jgi:hypothetical protein
MTPRNSARGSVCRLSGLPLAHRYQAVSRKRWSRPSDLFLVKVMGQWDVNSQGQIRIEPKDDIKKRLGRSPDYGDGLALTYAPETTVKIEGGVLKGVGAW